MELLDKLYRTFREIIEKSVSLDSKGGLVFLRSSIESEKGNELLQNYVKNLPEYK